MCAISPEYIPVFLSHSHKDSELVDGVINLLSKIFKSKIYVDWKDSSMPSMTNRETALRIKDKISTLNFFIVLATANAIRSRWVPWEIGIADSKKDVKKIIIFPLADQTGKFEGSEYLQLYPSIRLSISNTFQYFGPNDNVVFDIPNYLASLNFSN